MPVLVSVCREAESSGIGSAVQSMKLPREVLLMTRNDLMMAILFSTHHMFFSTAVQLLCDVPTSRRDQTPL